MRFEFWKVIVVAVAMVFALALGPQPAAAQGTPLPPNFQDDWSSTYGNIKWKFENNQNYVGTYQTLQPDGTLGALKSITVESIEWVEAQKIYKVRGSWWNSTSANPNYRRGGGIEFRYNGTCKFDGVWWSAGSDKTTPWAGQCMKAQNIAYTENPTGVLPRISGVWSSTYGDIDWDRGIYGKQEEGKIIRVERTNWSEGSQAYVSEGAWGRSNGGLGGGFEFYYNGDCEFTGFWWRFETPKKRDVWKGKCKN